MNIRLSGAVLFLSVIFILVWSLMPFYWILITSIKPNNEIFSTPFVYIPSRIETIHFYKVFYEKSLHLYIRSSLIVSLSTTIITVTLAALAGYAFAKVKIKGKKGFLSYILAISAFPLLTIVGPLFLLLKIVNLLDTYIGLILPYVALNLPLSTWLLMSYFKELPDELIDAAKIDGCNEFQTFRVIAPLAYPAIFTVGILVFIFAYIEFTMALTFTSSDASRTVTVAISMIGGRYYIPFGQLAAASLTAILPTFIIVLLFQKKIISALTAGAVKE